MQPKRRKPKSAETAPSDSPSSSLAVAEKPKRKSKPKLPPPEPLPEKTEAVKTPVKGETKVEKKPDPKPKAPPKAKLLPSDIGWQPAEGAWRVGILLNPDRVVLGDGPRMMGYDCYCTSLEAVESVYDETREGAIEKIKAAILKKIGEFASRKPPEKPMWTSVVGVRRPEAEATTVLVKPPVVKEAASG